MKEKFQKLCDFLHDCRENGANKAEQAPASSNPQSPTQKIDVSENDQTVKSYEGGGAQHCKVFDGGFAEAAFLSL